MLENVPPLKNSLQIKDFKFIIDKMPGLKAHLNIGHAFIENRMRGIEKYISTFKNDIAHLHIHDNHGKEDEHLPIGREKINYNLVTKMLKNIGYNKTITFEVFTNKKDAVKSREKIKKLWEKV